MKVLFAVSSENISDAIIKKYQKDYKEILSYKKVYYFNAILKEIQKDKSYDRIVISEDLESFSNNNYDAIDKFIFEKLDDISDEAQDIDGNETSIILVCSDRHTKGSSFLVKLFSIGIYNALLGSEKSIEQICRLINKPRLKKEAKMYYQIDADEANYANKSSEEVSELEIQNILTHFKKLGKNTDKFADSFNNIAAQYTDDQLKIIINCLPTNVKVVLEDDCKKYQELMSVDGMVKKVNRQDAVNQEARKQSGIKIDIIENKMNANKMSGPIVIPSSVRTSKNKGPAPVRPMGNNIEVPVTKPEQERTKKIVKKSELQRTQATAETAPARPTRPVSAQPVATQKTVTPTSKNVETVNAEKTVKPVQKVNAENKVVRPVAPQVKKEQVPPINLSKTPKAVVTDPAEKKRRGRPKKVEPQEIEKEEDLDDIMLPGMMDDFEDDELILPEVEEKSFEDEEDLLPGMEEDTFEDEEDLLPGMEEDTFEDEEDLLPGMEEDTFEEEEDLLPGMEEDTFEEEEDLLPGMEENTLEDEEDLLPGMEENTLEDEEDLLPGMEESPLEEEDDLLPDLEDDGLDDFEDDTLPGMGDDFEDFEEDTLPGMMDDFEEVDETMPLVSEDAEEEEYTDEVALPGLDELDDLESESDVQTEKSIEEILPGAGDDFEDGEDDLLAGFDVEDDFNTTTQTASMNQSTEIESIKPKVDYSMSSLNSLLTKDKKIVTFVGTSKNGTSFLINTLAALFSSLGINTAILDMTKNKNSYYIYTNNEEELRNIAYNSISKLQKGFAEGIKVGKNLSVYTALPNDGKDYSDAEPILSTLVQNHSLILIDCDFDTDTSYFASCQEIYLVQSMDILTIQPLTAFLRKLKTEGGLEPEKVRVVINKELKVRSLTTKAIIGGMSFYNDPSMSFMTELFNKDMVKACSIPFDESAYSKYLDAMVNCNVSINGYSKQFMSKLRNLGDMVYPLVSKSTYGKSAPQTNYGKNNFSNNMNNTLNQMKKKY